jgi:hypothetical protein
MIKGATADFNEREGGFRGAVVTAATVERGSGGRPPRKIAALGEAAEGSEHRSWARRDLNPHVLADTRT